MRPRVLLVVLGVIAAFVLSEAGARAVLADLPDAREWPTPESEIKNAQLIRLAGKGVEVDVVFVGSSALEAGIDPDLFREHTGLIAYNAALPFSSPLSNEIWLERFVLPQVQPDTVVIGLGVWPYESSAEDDLLAAQLDAVASSDGSRIGLVLLDRRRQLRSWSDSALRIDQVRSDVFTDSGHQTAYYEMSAGPGEGSSFDGSKAARMSEDNLAALSRTIRMLQERSIDVVILLEPAGCPPKVERCARFPLEDHPGLALSHEYGLQVIDAASRPWPQRFYADTAHFNSSGTEALTDFVARALSGTAGDESTRARLAPL